MSDKKANFLVPAIGAAIVAAGGAGAYFYYFKGRQSPIAPSVAGAMSIIPDRALLAASISTDSATWSKLERFERPETRKLFDNTLKEWQKEAFANSDFTFDKDIKPWAGNVTVAVLPPGSLTQSRRELAPRYLPAGFGTSGRLAQGSPEQDPPKTTPDTKDAQDPNVLVVVEVKNQDSATQFANKMAAVAKEKRNAKTDKRNYKGVEISVTSGGETLTSAFLGSYFVMAPQPQLVEQAIDTFQNKTSLAKTLETSGKLDLANPLVQVYVPNVAAAVEQIAKANPNGATIPPQSLEQLKQIQSVTLGIGVDDAGIRLKGITKFDPSAQLAEYKPAAGKVLERFPTDTLMLVTGTNLKGRWEQFTRDAEKTPELKQGLDEMRKGLKESPLAIDLDKDIFGWMDGEFGIGAVASAEGILAQFGVGPTLLFQTGNRAAAEALLSKLDEFARTNGATVGDRDVGGVKVTEWSAPGAPGAIVGHGWYDKDAFFVAVGPLAQAFATQPAQPLVKDSAFQAIAGTLSKTNIGYFYLDMEKSWALVEKNIPSSEQAEITAEARAAINTVRGIGAIAAMPDKTTSNFELIVALKPAAK